LPASIVSIGSNSTVVTGKVTITLSAAVPAGAQIVVLASYNSTGNAGSCADSGSNTYSGGPSANNNGNATLGTLASYIATANAGLANGGTITFTLPSGATLASVAAVYLLGVVTGTLSQSNSGSGVGTNPSISTVANVQSGQAAVAAVSGSSLITSFTQDTADGWSSPIGDVSNAAPVLAGGSQVIPASGSLTYAPTFGSSDNWAAVVLIFLSWTNWIPEDHLKPNQQAFPTARNRFAATKGRAEFAVFSNFVPYADAISGQQPFTQPPHFRSEKAASTMRGDDGNEAVYLRFFNFGFENQAWQPPARPMKQPIDSKLRGEDGNEYPIIVWNNPGGWLYALPHQPAHPRSEKAGILAVGDPISEGIKITFWSPGWEVQSWQPPHRAPEWRSSILWRGDDGTEAPFQRWLATGWEPTLLNGYRWPYLSGPPAPGKLLDTGDSGIEGKLTPAVPLFPWGHEQPFLTNRVVASNRGAATKGKSEFAIIPNLQVWWEVTPSPQPPHPRPERSGATAIGFSQDSPPVRIAAPWFEVQQQLLANQPRVTQRGAIAHTVAFAFYQLNPWWETWDFREPHPRPERSGALQIGEGNISGTEYPIIQWFNYGWPVQPPMIRHPMPERAGSIMPLSQIDTLFPWSLFGWEPYSVTYAKVGVRARLVQAPDIGAYVAPPPFTIYRSEIQSWQPPHPRPEKGGSLAGGDFGVTFQQLLPQFYQGWEVLLWQPPHPRPEKGGSIARGDDGTEAKFQFVPPSFIWAAEVQYSYVLPRQPMPLRDPAWRVDNGADWPTRPWLFMGFEVQQPPPPHPRSERWAAVFPEDDGTEAPLYRWQNYGWQIEPPSPPHVRFERAAGVLPIVNPDGTLPPFYQWGWENAPALPPHPRPERFGANARGDDGTELNLAFWVTAGRGSQDFQPPHPRPERAGSTLKGDEGIEGIYHFVTAPFAWSLDVHYAYPHRPFRDASWRGDDGTQGLFSQWINVGWEPTPPMLYFPRQWRAGATMRGDDGNEGRYQFWVNRGWEETTVDIPRRRVERVGTLPGDDGIEALYKPFIPIFTWWFPYQPQRIPFNREAAIAAGDHGTELPFVPPFVGGGKLFEPPQYWRARSKLDVPRWEEGTEAPMQQQPITGWDGTPPVLQIPWFKFAAAFMAGSPGIDAVYYVPVFYAKTTITWMRGVTVVKGEWSPD
jgi:hypothetical protein